MRVDDVTQAETLALVEAFIQGPPPQQVVTVNPEFIMAAREDGEFANVLEGAALALPDGVGVLWAARMLGYPLRERVAGVDAVGCWAGLAEEKGYGVFLLGAGEGVAEEAGRRLRERYPRLAVVGTFAGSPGFKQEEEIVERIKRAFPQMLFVAYGAPQQDKWIARNLGRLGVPVAMGVGGAFDFLARRAERAPHWMRRLGLEWLYRLIRQPWRWRRMLVLPHFAWLVVVSALKGRLLNG